MVLQLLEMYVRQQENTTNKYNGN